MFKHTIKYNDLDGNEIVEDFYFHISESEQAKMELREKGGITKRLEDMLKNAEDRPAEVIDTFEWFIEKAYGVRSADRKSFDKDDAYFRAFKNSDAYNKMFMQLITDTNFAVEFTNGIMAVAAVSDGPSVEQFVQAQQNLRVVETVPPTVLDAPEKPLMDQKELDDFRAWQAQNQQAQD